MKRFITKEYVVWFGLIVLSLLIVWPLFLPGFFSHHDDLHVMRIFEMRRCFTDLQIPCRWVPDMGYGNGFPLYNYYGVLPFYIGAVASYILGFIGAVKLLFFIPLVLGGVSMFLLGRELFGTKAGLVTAIFYMYAPYRAVDSYIRGAIGESFALALIPLLFYAYIRLVKEGGKKNFFFSTVIMGLFLITHNLSLVIFMPIFICTITYLLFRGKWKNIFQVITSLIIGLGLSSFYLLPAYFEKGFVQIDTLTRGDLNFRANFVQLPRLFLDVTANQEYSLLPVSGQLSFQVGWPLWLFVIVAFLLLLSGLFLRWRKRSSTLISKELLVVGGFFALFFSISLFMQHNKSAFVWEAIGFLRFIQFPWRYLGLSIFTGSLLAGLVVYVLKGRLQNIVLMSGIIIVVLINWGYFRPAHFYPQVTDEYKLRGDEWDIQRKAAILDYLPKTAGEPGNPASETPQVALGQAEISNFINTSDKWQFNARVGATSVIEVPVFEFPNWVVTVNGKKIEHKPTPNGGLISLALSPGDHIVVGTFENTEIRAVANIITLLSMGGLIMLACNRRIQKKFNLK